MEINLDHFSKRTLSVFQGDAEIRCAYGTWVYWQ